MTPTIVGGHAANYDHLAARIEGFCEGFAFANGITTQQVVTGVKKTLTW